MMPAPERPLGRAVGESPGVAHGRRKGDNLRPDEHVPVRLDGAHPPKAKREAGRKGRRGGGEDAAMSRRSARRQILLAESRDARDRESEGVRWCYLRLPSRPAGEAQQPARGVGTAVLAEPAAACRPGRGAKGNASKPGHLVLLARETEKPPAGRSRPPPRPPGPGHRSTRSKAKGPGATRPARGCSFVGDEVVRRPSPAALQVLHGRRPLSVAPSHPLPYPKPVSPA
jgi:hypothetical protein